MLEKYMVYFEEIMKNVDRAGREMVPSLADSKSLNHHAIFCGLLVLFPLTQVFYYLLYIGSQFMVYYFPPVFWRKYYMILANPFRMC